MKIRNIIVIIAIFSLFSNNLALAERYSQEVVDEKVEDIIQEVYKEVSKIANHYLPLQDFRSRVRVSSSMIEYKNKIGHPNRTYPSGILLDDNSCLFRLRIQEISHNPRRKYPNVIFYKNLNLEAIIEINLKPTHFRKPTHELKGGFTTLRNKGLGDILNDIVSNQLEELEELNENTSPAPEDY